MERKKEQRRIERELKRDTKESKGRGESKKSESKTS